MRIRLASCSSSVLGRRGLLATPPSADEFFRVRVCRLAATGAFGSCSAGGDNDGAEDADDADDAADEVDMRGSDVELDTIDGLYSRPSVG